MTREIKFRGWSKPENKMVQVLEIRFWKEEVMTILIKEDTSSEKVRGKNDVEIMQFTGLKDKNGKEIYAGDIVHHRFYNEYFEVICNEKNASFSAKYIPGNGRYSGGIIDKIFAIDFEEYEVIGNIYQNPELLK